VEKLFLGGRIVSTNISLAAASLNNPSAKIRLIRFIRVLLKTSAKIRLIRFIRVLLKTSAIIRQIRFIRVLSKSLFIYFHFYRFYVPDVFSVFHNGTVT
jgi:hypothetical protein